jgi:hypothetical protein
MHRIRLHGHIKQLGIFGAIRIFRFAEFVRYAKQGTKLEERKTRLERLKPGHRETGHER